ncbi:hypothetical protein GOD07_25795 [Sinorhizobium medicae]|nr:hypothetical protein [Sinorhizobium medicae]
MIRSKIQNIGGPHPGRGAAPAMTRDFHLPRGQRAGFEKLNDAAAMRPTVIDAGSLVPANDNKRVRLVTDTGTETKEDAN